MRILKSLRFNQRLGNRQQPNILARASHPGNSRVFSASDSGSMRRYPAQIRSLLMYRALGGLIIARWSDEIHKERIESLLLHRQNLTRTQAERIRDRMNAHVLEATASGYEPWITRIELPDPGDRHVLAAAIHCRATMIATFNIRDFPQDRLTPHNVEAVHPDELVLRLVVKDHPGVCTACANHRSSLKNPPKSPEEYLQILESGGLRQSARELRQNVALL